MKKSGRYFSKAYGSEYAAYVLEKKGHIKRLPRKGREKTSYNILTLPSLSEYRRLEEEVQTLTGDDILAGVERHLRDLSNRSLQRGASLLSMKASEDAVIPVEDDMEFFQDLARRVDNLIDRMGGPLGRLEDIQIRYAPPVLLLYPTRGWPMRKTLIQSILDRLNLLLDRFEDEDLRLVVEDLGRYKANWWGKKDA